MDERQRIPTRVGSLAVHVRGEGPPAVLWHSLFVDERSWERVEAGLDRERRLVIITGPGRPIRIRLMARRMTSATWPPAVIVSTDLVTDA